MTMRGLMLAGGIAASLAIPGVAHAGFADGVIKIGVLTDLSGPYEGNGGHGSVVGGADRRGRVR